MVDRFQTRPFANKIDSRLQTVVTSPYARSQLQLAGLINRRGQIIADNDYLRLLTPRKHQRREVPTAETILRALKIDQEQRRGRFHQSEGILRRASSSNLEILSRRRRHNSHGSDKSREKSAASDAPKTENNSERRLRVTSAHTRQLKENRDSPKFDQWNQEDVPSEGLHACQITMSYGLPITVSNRKSIPDEVIVVHQHSTGENLVVYKGYLIEGESFSFKIQRQPTSTLSLAFYAKGFIDSVVNDCCEFRYKRRKHRSNEHSQFSVKQIRNPSSCEKCRTKYSQRIPSSNAMHSEHPQQVDHQYLTPTPRCSVNNEEEVSPRKQNSILKKHNEDKQKRHSVAVTSFYDDENQHEQIEHINRGRSGSVNFSLLELALIHEGDPSTQVASPTPENSVENNVDFIRNKDLLEQNMTPTPSQQNLNIQEWINQTDAASCTTHRSNDVISTVDVESLCPISTDDSHQQLPNISHDNQPIELIRHEKNVENFIYILDGALQISTNDKKRLHGLINFGMIFDNINDTECIEYINQVVDEQIIIILSRSGMENLVKSVHDSPQLRSIYVVDNIIEGSHDFNKIRGIYSSITSAYDQLETDILLFTHDLTTILSISANDTNDNAFIYAQVLKDILLENDETTILKKEMLDFCRKAYADNEIQMKFIAEFERSFRPNEAVKWYLRQETFLFKMLTRAFRIPDPDILFKLRYFIQQLHCQLKSNLRTTSMTVYRIQCISNNYFDTISKHQGGLLSFNQFLSAKKTKIKRKSPYIDSEFITVLFQIELDKTIPMIEIETNPEELLITAATIFRISTIKRTDNKMPVVKLTSNSDTLGEIQVVTKNAYETTRASFPLLRMAKLMKYMNYIQYTEYFCLMLIDDPLIVNNETASLIVGGLFHMLCCYYYEQQQYERAFEQLQKSLKIYLRVLPADDIRLTPTYNNIGSIYHKQGLDEQALDFHQKAYDIQINSSNPDPDSVAAYAGNIASVLVKQGRYEEAIPYLQRDLQIQQRLSSNGNNLHLSTRYHNLAGALFKINKYHKALENYKKCLEIELKLHPANHPTIAVTYYNMATVLENLGQLEEAIKMIGKAIDRLSLTRNENDEEIQMYKEYEKYLREKL